MPRRRRGVSVSVFSFLPLDAAAVRTPPRVGSFCIVVGVPPVQLPRKDPKRSMRGAQWQAG